MNLKQLEAFVQVADLKSFSKAAGKLFLTQPTISAHIASLEKELNVRLFVRNTKEVHLSKEGEKLYKYAKQMTDLEGRIRELFLADQDDNLKNITIAASTVPAQYLLPEMLSRFYGRYPKEQLQVIETDSAKVVEKIVDGSADIGFTGTVLDKKHCRYIPFYRDELVVIMPNTETYQQRILGEQGMKWLLEEKLIMREDGSGTRKEAEKQLKAMGIAPMDLNVIASIENQETIKRSVMNGLGVSIISKLAARDEVAEGKMLSIPLNGDGGGRDLNLIYNKNCQLSSSAEKFVRIVKQLHKTK